MPVPVRFKAARITIAKVATLTPPKNCSRARQNKSVRGKRSGSSELAPVVVMAETPSNVAVTTLPVAPKTKKGAEQIIGTTVQNRIKNKIASDALSLVDAR